MRGPRYSPSGPDRALAIAEAVFAELPLAGAAIWLAVVQPISRVSHHGAGASSGTPGSMR